MSAGCIVAAFAENGALEPLRACGVSTDDLAAVRARLAEHGRRERVIRDDGSALRTWAVPLFAGQEVLGIIVLVRPPRRARASSGVAEARAVKTPADRNLHGRRRVNKLGKPAAKGGDRVVGIDTHVIMVPSPVGPVPTPTPMPFDGPLGDGLSADVIVENKPAAIVGSSANSVPHVPAGGTFQAPPSNRGSVTSGSSTVLINNKAAARLGDTATTCNDPADAPVGTLIAEGTVLMGD
jgi:uncharacterized Zn-binding protein involved in type VI secretion